MRSHIVLALRLSYFFFTYASAVLAPLDSPCAIKCGNVLQSTSKDDVACGDSSFTTQPGQTLQNCVECEMDSTYVQAGGISDLQAAIYNLRYTTSYCIFNHSTVASTPCITDFSCGHFLSSLNHKNLAVPTGQTSYEYCDGWDDGVLFRCQNCLHQLGNEQYLVNYMIALSASCQQKPPPGKTIAIDGSVFSSTIVNITDPLASSNALASTFHRDTGLSLGAKIGIAVGSLVAILIIAGCIIVCRGKRRRRAVLAAYAGNKCIGETQQIPKWQERNILPVAEKAIDDSPQSMSSNAFITKSSNYNWPANASSVGDTESPLSPTPQVWSPYVSHHASPISPVNGLGGVQWPSMPIPRPYSRDSTGLQPRHAALQHGEQIEMGPISMSTSPGADREQWAREAGEVGFVPAPAPTIMHPGHGRQHSYGEAI